ncbi:MAG: glycosyltransferase family 2 protein [Candidatus Buchananbacteria bacterium]
MKISIVIVSWNVKDLLQKCLNSIINNPLYELTETFVVDNASKDGSAEMVKEKFPQINLIASDKNLGFAKGNNVALKKCTGDYILFLNPDTEIFTDTLQKSVEFMAQNPNCGIMGCKMLYGDKSFQPSVRRFPSLWPIFLMLIKAPKIFKKIKAIDRYMATDFDYNKAQEVDQVMGAYMFVKKEVIDRVGAFDERFFYWFEEVDFCLRVKKAGFKIMYDPKTIIIHHGGKSFAQQKTINNQKIFFQSAFKYFMKNNFTKKYGETKDNS